MSDYIPGVSKALILAAGDGSRLKNRTPKPALNLLGIPLLARTLFSLERAGIEEAYVVLGYESERVRREVERIDRLNIRVHWLYNDRWEEPNGLSVLAAESDLNEPFILAMSDHLIDPEIVSRLMNKAPELEGIDLAVDYNVSRVSDLEDATKVRLESDRIRAIGKGLRSFEAVDTGVFLASPELFRALRRSCDRGGAALSDGVQELADAGRARVTDIGNLTWQDIDTQSDVEVARSKLLKGVRKSTDGPISRYLNRPLSTAVSRLLVRTPVTPNQISVGTLVLSLVAAGTAAVGGYLPMLVGAVLFQLASVLDGSDGEVAKLTYRTSVRGEWVDTVCDNLSYLAFVIGVIVGVHRMGLPDFYMQSGIVGLVAAFASILNISVYLFRKKESGSALSVRYGFEEGRSRLSRVLRVVQYLGKRDMMAFLVLVMAVVGQLPLLLPVLALGATLLLFPATLKANLPQRWFPDVFRRPRPVLSTVLISGEYHTGGSGGNGGDPSRHSEKGASRSASPAAKQAL